jgi:endo-1,4-beta-xylanase
MTAHITTVMEHYAGQCYAWDVVNEALNEDGTFRDSVFLTTLGDSYIPLSFTLAAAADPSTKLYYNDFNLETSSAKADGAFKIVQLIQAAGAKIDGVGFQAHLNVGQTPSRAELTATLERFTALGVEVAYTELDVAHTSLPASDADNEQQAVDYVAAVGSCLDVEGCVGVTVWQFTDLYSWVPSTFPGKGEACLYTEDYQKKPAYEAVLALLQEAAAAAAGVGSGAGSGGAGGSVGGGYVSNSTNGTGYSNAAGQNTLKAPVGFNGASAVVGGFAGLVLPAVAALLVV